VRGSSSAHQTASADWLGSGEGAAAWLGRGEGASASSARGLARDGAGV